MSNCKTIAALVKVLLNLPLIIIRFWLELWPYCFIFKMFIYRSGVTIYLSDMSRNTGQWDILEAIIMIAITKCPQGLKGNLKWSESEVTIEAVTYEGLSQQSLPVFLGPSAFPSFCVSFVVLLECGKKIRGKAVSSWLCYKFLLIKLQQERWLCGQGIPRGKNYPWALIVHTVKYVMFQLPDQIILLKLFTIQPTHVHVKEQSTQMFHTFQLTWYTQDREIHFIF